MAEEADRLAYEFTCCNEHLTGLATQIGFNAVLPTQVVLNGLPKLETF